MPVIRQNQYHREFRVGAARHSQRTSSGHSRYQMALKVELLHPEMPVCRSLSFILHNVSFQPSPSNKAACRSAYLEWGYCLRRPGYQHEQRIANRSKRSYAPCTQCHLIVVCKPDLGIEFSGSWSTGSSLWSISIATRKQTPILN